MDFSMLARGTPSSDHSCASPSSPISPFIGNAKIIMQSIAVSTPTYSRGGPALATPGGGGQGGGSQAMWDEFGSLSGDESPSPRGGLENNPSVSPGRGGRALPSSQRPRPPGGEKAGDVPGTAQRRNSSQDTNNKPSTRQGTTTSPTRRGASPSRLGAGGPLKGLQNRLANTPGGSGTPGPAARRQLGPTGPKGNSPVGSPTSPEKPRPKASPGGSGLELVRGPTKARGAEVDLSPRGPGAPIPSAPPQLPDQGPQGSPPKRMGRTPIPSAPPQLPGQGPQGSPPKRMGRTYSNQRSNCSDVMEESLVGLGAMNGFGVDEDAVFGGSSHFRAANGNADGGGGAKEPTGPPPLGHRSSWGLAAPQKGGMPSIHTGVGAKGSPDLLDGLHANVAAMGVGNVNSPVVHRGAGRADPFGHASHEQVQGDVVWGHGHMHSRLAVNSGPAAAAAAHVPLDILFDEDFLLSGGHGRSGGDQGPPTPGAASANTGPAGGAGPILGALSGGVHSEQMRAFTPPVVPLSKAGANTVGKAGAQGGAHAATGQRIVQLKGGGEEMLELVYDPVLNCYYDSKTNQYFQLKQ
eukprot:gene26396-17490_t